MGRRPLWVNKKYLETKGFKETWKNRGVYRKDGSEGCYIRDLERTPDKRRIYGWQAVPRD